MQQQELWMIPISKILCKQNRICLSHYWHYKSTRKSCACKHYSPNLLLGTLEQIRKLLVYLSSGKKGRQGPSVFLTQPRVFTCSCMFSSSIRNTWTKEKPDKHVDQLSIALTKPFTRATHKRVKWSMKSSIATAGPKLLYWSQPFLRLPGFGCGHWKLLRQCKA